MRHRSALATLGIAGIALLAVAPITIPASAATATTAKYTLAQVKTHKTAANCWAAINGSVYNLTKWIPLHPGGAPIITSLCGTNATAMFTGKHGADARAKSFLAKYRIGALAATPAVTPSKSASATPSATASVTPSASASTSAATTVLTAAVVATHNSAKDCWAIINKNVYNLTAWIPAHPGGSALITALCGTDGTVAFTQKHGKAGTPNRTLAQFMIGVIGAAPTTTATPTPSAAASTVYKAADVQSHKTATDCWVAINGSVYDVTDWITRHPGGQRVIIAACGLDASMVFASERDHQRPQNLATLAAFKIGTLDATSGSLQSAARSRD